MAPKDVVLVVETTFPPVSRANLRLYKLGVVLVRKGHKVCMVSPSETFLDKREIQEYEGIKVEQFRGFNKYLYSKIRVLVRAYHFLASLCTLLLLNSKKRIDVIHAWNPLAGIAAIVGGKLLGRNVYIDFTDFYSDIAIDDSPYAVKLLRSIEMFVLKNASKVMVVSSVMKDRLSALGINKEKIHVVPDGTDPKAFNPYEDGNSIRDKLNLHDNPIIIYHGDIKHLDGVDILLKSFKGVLKSIPNAYLLILGGSGDYFENLKKSARELGITESVVFLGWVSHSEVAKYICAADVGAMTLRPTLNHECYLSFKLFEYWGCAKPVVLTRLKAISEIMKDGVHGIQVDFGDIDKYTDAFVDLLLDKEKAKQMGKNGRKLVEEKFDWDKIMEKEADLYGD